MSGVIRDSQTPGSSSTDDPESSGAHTPEQGATIDGNPFPGTRSFTVDESDRLFGRSTATIELVSLLRAQRIVLLYGPSGSGKTSLLEARILPELQRQAGFHILPIVHVDPGILSGRHDIGDPRRLYESAALLSLDSETDPAGSLTTWLSDHAEGGADEFGHPRPTLLVLDQFEQILETFGGSEHRGSRRNFLNRLSEALDQNEHLRLLVSIREEHLARIEVLGAVLARNSFRARYRLGWLTRDEAKEAIEGPTKLSAVTFAPELVKELLDQLVGDTDDTEDGRAVPAQLQIVCRRIWDEADRRGRRTVDGRLEAGPDLLARDIGVEQTLEEHYDAGIEWVSRSPLHRWRIRRFFDRLITPSGTRKLVARSQRQHPWSLDRALDRLSRRYNLLKAETRAGTSYWELSLNSLIGPIQRSNSRARRKRALVLALFGSLTISLVTGIVVDRLTTEQRRLLATIESVTVAGGEPQDDLGLLYDGDTDTAVEIQVENQQEVKLEITFDQVYQISDVAVVTGADGPGPTRAYLVNQQIEVNVGQAFGGPAAYGRGKEVTLTLVVPDIERSIWIAEMEFVRR